jgi:hypothetical protein
MSDETPQVKSRQDDVYRTIERSHHERELFSRLLAKKYRAMAYFGKDVAEPFHELKAINDRVVRAAMLIIPRIGSDGGVAISSAQPLQWMGFLTPRAQRVFLCSAFSTKSPLVQLERRTSAPMAT